MVHKWHSCFVRMRKIVRSCDFHMTIPAHVSFDDPSPFLKGSLRKKFLFRDEGVPGERGYCSEPAAVFLLLLRLASQP